MNKVNKYKRRYMKYEKKMDFTGSEDVSVSYRGHQLMVPLDPDSDFISVCEHCGKHIFIYPDMDELNTTYSGDTQEYIENLNDSDDDPSMRIGVVGSDDSPKYVAVPWCEVQFGSKPAPRPLTPEPTRPTDKIL